jgi:hypothetical protein
MRQGKINRRYTDHIISACEAFAEVDDKVPGDDRILDAAGAARLLRHAAANRTRF